MSQNLEEDFHNFLEIAKCCTTLKTWLDSRLVVRWRVIVSWNSLQLLVLDPSVPRKWVAPRLSWKNLTKYVCFFVLGNIPRNIPAGILRWWEFLGIWSEWMDVKGSNRAVWSPKFLVNHWVVCGCEERTGAQTPSTMPCPSLIQSTITSKSHLNVQWSKLKTNIYGKSSIVYKDKERADLFTAMFSLMLKENPVAVTSWFIDLKGYFMRREHPVSAYNFSIGWHKWMTFYYHDLFSTRPKSMRNDWTKQKTSCWMIFFEEYTAGIQQ